MNKLIFSNAELRSLGFKKCTNDPRIKWYELKIGKFTLACNVYCGFMLYINDDFIYPKFETIDELKTFLKILGHAC